MSLRSSLVALGLVGCVPVYDPVVICHNANCDGTGRFLDDTMIGLESSLALRYDGKPMFDGVEIDTYLYSPSVTQPSTCLFAHDSLDPDSAATPNDAAALVAQFLTNVRPISWNEDRFYLKIELKPTVEGTDRFHTAQQAIQHVRCVIDMIEIATNIPEPVPVTVIIDSTSECQHQDFSDEMLAQNRTFTNPLVVLQHSGPIVSTRQCSDFPLDVRTFFVRSWRDSEIEAIRPAMVWMDRSSENTETLKIIRHIRPEYVTTSAAPYVRGWIEGYR
jgi:hypothetical protein